MAKKLGRNQGENNPMYGKKHTKESKKLMSGIMKQMFKEGKIIKLIGDKNPAKRPEVRKQMSESRKGKYLGESNPFYGKHHTEEVKKSMSQKAKLRTGEKNSFYKKHHTGKSKKQMSESRKKAIKEGKITTVYESGNKHPQWMGGKSFEPYGLDFNKKLRKAIRERDGCCMLCNIGFEDLKLLKRRTPIHHLDYVKTNNFPQNLITLCNSCHMKTNFNRTHWTTFFQSLLNERYNYEYQDQKIVLDFVGETYGKKI